jgi:NADH:ubiquinone oxidoreductase subunit F (NADH-binding)
VSTCIDAPRAALAAPAPQALPRLLAGIPARGALGLEQHVALHGEPPVQPSARRRGEAALIEQIEDARLLGRGGGAFPTARKLRAVASARRRAVVVINAVEGEPASRKDRTLMASLPHLVLDGGQLAAGAIGAEEVIVCACESARAGARAAAQAILERHDLASAAPPLRLELVPSHYLSGQESALISHLNGDAARPSFTPPLPFERGVGRRPTLVSNAETFAHLALIARHGADWFRALGTPSQPGSALVTLSGPVAYPGVYEIAYGASLASLIDAAGGITSGVRAALLGGYAGAWIGSEALAELTLSDEQLAPHGAAIGAGVVLLLSEQACPVAETARVASWLAAQSSGQCGPCVFGLDALATTVTTIAGARALAPATQRLASLVRGRGACGHPDGAVKFILSAVETFAAEFAEHARHGSCEACTRPAELPLPLPAAAQRAGLPEAMYA